MKKHRPKKHKKKQHSAPMLHSNEEIVQSEDSGHKPAHEEFQIQEVMQEKALTLVQYPNIPNVRTAGVPTPYKRSFLGFHIVAFLLALLAGLLTYYPQFGAVREMGPMFTGVYPEVNDDERYYLARAEEVRDGHSMSANPYLLEHKDTQPLQFWLPDYLLSRTSQILGLTPRAGFLLYDLVLPPILFLLTYGIGYMISARRRLALAVASVLHLGVFLGYFHRSPSPQLTFLVFLLLNFSFIRHLRTHRARWLVFSSVWLGLLFHFYTYYWIYYFVALPFFFLVSFVWKRNETPLLQYLAVLSGAIVIGIPYFVQSRLSAALPEYAETLARLGLLHTHSPSGFGVVVVGGLVSVLFLGVWMRRTIPVDVLGLYLLSGVLGALIAMNNHVITGVNLEYSSHFFVLSLYAIVFALLYLMQKLVNVYRSNGGERIFTVLSVLLLVYMLVPLSHTVKHQMHADARAVSEQRYGPVLEWLRNNTEKDIVVMTDLQLAPLVPAYTRDNILSAREANLHFLADREVWERFIAANYFEQNFNEEFVRANERAIFGTYYVNRAAHLASENRLRSVVGLPPVEIDRLPEEKITAVIQLHDEMRSSQRFMTVLAPFHVSYVVWDSVRHPEWRVAQLAALKEVVVIDDIHIYAVR